MCFMTSGHGKILKQEICKAPLGKEAWKEDPVEHQQGKKTLLTGLVKETET